MESSLDSSSQPVCRLDHTFLSSVWTTTIICRGTEDYHRQVAVSVVHCSTCGQRHQEVRPWTSRSGGLPTRFLQAGFTSRMMELLTTRSKTVKKFVHRQHWKTTDWHPQSPDLNPIENLPGVLRCEATTVLKARIIAIWNHGLEKELLEKLAYSMSD